MTTYEHPRTPDEILDRLERANPAPIVKPGQDREVLLFEAGKRDVLRQFREILDKQTRRHHVLPNRSGPGASPQAPRGS